MSATEINRIFYPIKLGRRAGSPLISNTSASCPDSSKNPYPITIGTIGRKEVKRQR
jgi:hypothetical protein